MGNIKVAAFDCGGCGKTGTIAEELLERDGVEVVHSRNSGGCGATTKITAAKEG